MGKGVWFGKAVVGCFGGFGVEKGKRVRVSWEFRSLVGWGAVWVCFFGRF